MASLNKFNKDKIFGDIFCRYLEKEFGWFYKAVDPETVKIPQNYPDIDIVLVSESADEKFLYLQLTQPLDRLEKEEKVMTKSSLRVFNGRPSIEAIKKKEDLYHQQGKEFGNTILGLHIYSDIGYSIKEEISVKSGFRGIYIIEQGHSYSSAENGPSKEWVCKIKNAFAEVS